MSGNIPLAEPQPMPFIEVIAHMRARRPRALMILALAVAATLLLAALLPPRFTATATLAVLPAPEFTVRQDAGSRVLSTSALAMDQVMKAETEILESADLHEGALRAVGMLNVYPNIDPASAGPTLRVARQVLHIALSPWIVPTPDSPAARLERALRQFESDLKVLPTKDANVIDVSFRHHDARMAAEVVNILLAKYAQRREQLYDDPQLEVVRRETDSLSRAVREADGALARFKIQHQISDYGAERDLLVRRQSATGQALADAEANAAEQQSRVAALDLQTPLLPSSVSLYQESDTDTRLQTIDASLVDLRAQVAAARVHYRDTSQKVTGLLLQLHTREAERRRLADNPAPSVTRAGRSVALDSLLLDHVRAVTDQAAASTRAGALREQLNDIANRLSRLTGEETALGELMRRKTAADAAFASASQVLAEQRMTEAEDALRLANVRVIQPARIPLQALPIPMLITAAGTLIGALSASLWCIAGVIVRPTFLTPEGLAHATGLPVLGVFPALAG
jgi:uncharacterized protein involved in exopolysaccharide biosynthesis